MSESLPESEDISSSPSSSQPPLRALWFFHDSPVALDDPDTPLPPSATPPSQPPPTQSPRKNRESSPSIFSPSPNGSPRPGRERNRSSARASSASIRADSQSINGIVSYPVFSSTSSIVGTISPNLNWQAFNPYDCKLLRHEYVEVDKKQANKDQHSDINDTDENVDDCQDNLIPVGYNRLYQVSVCCMEMTPIYWSSLRNSYNVHCSSWFFSSSLTPIEPSLEDAIEAAFMSIKPWTSTYLTELESAANVPEAMTKLSVPIVYFDGKSDIKVEVVFPPTFKRVCNGEQYSGDDKGEGDDAKKNEDEDFDSEAIAVAASEAEAAEVSEAEAEAVAVAEAKHSTHSDTDGTPSRPNALPYPIAYILSGPSSISIPYLYSSPTPAQLISSLISGKTPPGTLFTVQRHFSWQDWKKIKNLPERPTDLENYEPRKVTQLILVFHGIGQKLTERVESFNFTYAINSFRIQVSNFADSATLSQYVKQDTNILTLPINWRRTVNFENLKGAEHKGTDPLFALSDITMKSIPTVRNLISDVMLDIPYYMSRHKSLLLDAAAREANRVYSLFVKMNPYFIESKGTVNIIGHSLGSTIAVDLLSSQPTDVTKCTKEGLDQSRTFNFNVQNLFLVGSPVAFFLLLENSQLYPREIYERENNLCSPNHKYPYGCIAVRNVYNILHYSDPIAYYLGPTADRFQASLIETATLPSERSFAILGSETNNGTGWVNAFTSRLPFMGERTPPAKPSSSALEDHVPSASAREEEKEDEAKDAVVSEVLAKNIESEEMPAKDDYGEELEDVDGDPLAAAEPGQALELETRDFQKESIGEERLSLLNENGQVDWIIPLTTSLESVSQYVSMLTAHSGYWDSKDFARMVAIECGRPSGIDNTLPQFRAKKKVNL